ncbi:MAG: dihydrofolate reductase [Planctomycetaceae bacterium]
MRDSKPELVIIAAMSRNRVIGDGEGMPWDVPEEYEHFRETTRHQTVIIGRRSFKIFGPTFTCTNCYVVTRSDRVFPEATTVHSLEDAVSRATRHHATVFVAGGASIYREAIDIADCMQLSYIDGAYSGDALFPEFDLRDWVIVRQERRPRYEFVEYIRKRQTSDA